MTLDMVVSSSQVLNNVGRSLKNLTVQCYLRRCVSKIVYFSGVQRRGGGVWPFVMRFVYQCLTDSWISVINLCSNFDNSDYDIRRVLGQIDR